MLLLNLRHFRLLRILLRLISSLQTQQCFGGIVNVPIVVDPPTSSITVINLAVPSIVAKTNHCRTSECRGVCSVYAACCLRSFYVSNHGSLISSLVFRRLVFWVDCDSVLTTHRFDFFYLIWILFINLP